MSVLMFMCLCMCEVSHGLVPFFEIMGHSTVWDTRTLMMSQVILKRSPALSLPTCLCVFLCARVGGNPHAREPRLFCAHVVDKTQPTRKTTLACARVANHSQLMCTHTANSNALSALTR